MQELNSVLFLLVSDLRKIAIMLLPFFDTKMRELLSRIGTPYDDTISLSQNLEIKPDIFFVKEK